jgi:parvulin-like peptidyl-prolyl isomerase
MLQWVNYARDHFTDADVKKYYDENLDFFNQVTVRASHIMLRTGPNSTEAEKQSARNRLLALRQEILAGKIDFAEAARKYSQCPSAPNGGDIGYFPRKWVVEEAFAKTAFSMRPGEVSDIVETEFGLHIIRVLERKPGQASDYNKIKDEVREFFVEEMRQQLLAQERKRSQIQVNIK